VRYRPRRLAATLKRALRTFPAALVTGARQSGKTTLLRNELSGHRYVSLERPDARARALADPEGFLSEAGVPLVLDEIQYAPVLLHNIKERIDADRRPGRYVLTGSQTFPLMRGVSQSLAGRVAVLSLDPLSAGEAGGAPEATPPDRLLARVFGPGRRGPHPRTPPDAADWLLRGGYPEPRLNRRVDREIWFASYVQTYLERDVRDLLRVTDLESFRRFLFLAATRTGQLLNLAELGGELGVSAPTVRQWLSVLQTSQVVYLLRPYHRNLGKRIRKSPKLYFMDVGLATFLLGLHSRPAVLQGPSLGPLLETAVVAEWVKAFRGSGLEPPLSFWRASDGREVDLVIEYGGRVHAVEVKATATPVPAHAANLATFAGLAGSGTRTALACRIDTAAALRPGVRAVPWHLAW
jgi:predicted AAA+ superfamily ATPase